MKLWIAIAICYWVYTMMPLLSYELLAKKTYILGHSVTIDFALTNHSSSELSILKWYTPLEGINGRIFEVTCDGNVIPYQGRLVKRGNPSLGDYLELKPGESVHAQFDLSRFYSLPICSQLNLVFNGTIHDVQLGKLKQPRVMDDHQSMAIPGNIVSFSIVQ